MDDWLGTVTVWNRNAIIAFLHDLQPHLLSFEPVELLKILQQNGMLDATGKGKKNSNRHLLGQIATCATIGDQMALADVIAQALEHPEQIPGPEEDGAAAEVPDLDAPLPADAVPDLLGEGDLDAIAQRENGLPAFNACKSLDAVDFTVQYAGPDAEAVEFFIANAVGKLWRGFLHDEGSFDLDALVQHPAGEYGARVRARFLEQLEGARSLPIPSGYAYPFAPLLMQRLIAYRLLTEHRLGNWSGTGAGKTLGTLLASRVCDARLTVVVGLNSTIEEGDTPQDKQHGWAKEIRTAFPDTRILIKERGPLVIDPEEHTIVLLNFETFQQESANALIRHLVEDHHIDMIALDEVHSAKQRGQEESQRRKHLMALLSAAAHKNPALRVLGMSATPVVNDLTEARSLLEMIQGMPYPDLKTFPNLANVMALYEKLVVHGIRYVPKYSMLLHEEHVPCAGDDLAPTLARIGKRDMLGMEQALLPAKLATITQHLGKGSLIYSHYVDGIVPALVDAVRQAGFTCATYVGDDRREDGFTDFVKGEVDVLIGSDKLQQGVDGLQERCNRLIIATSPWTGAGYDQLVGRIYRQGSRFDAIHVVIPQVVVATDGEEWSYDRWRHARIVSKKTLADAVVDGVMPDGLLETQQALLGRAQDALKGWIARLEKDGLAPMIERPLLRVPLPEETMRQARRHWGAFSEMNRHWATSHGSTTHQRLQADPTEWYAYHTLYREARKDWPEVPYETFAQWLRARPHLIVGDFGCGEAQLAAVLPNTVFSFDHVAINEGVTTCDMAHTPLEDGVLDIADFSLSLMGTNWHDYLKEAHRVLKLDGRLCIAETMSRWEGDKRAELLGMIGALGFRLIGTVEERDRFLYIDAIKA